MAAFDPSEFRYDYRRIQSLREELAGAEASFAPTLAGVLDLMEANGVETIAVGPSYDRTYLARVLDGNGKPTLVETRIPTLDSLEIPETVKPPVQDTLQAIHPDRDEEDAAEADADPVPALIGQWVVAEDDGDYRQD